MSSLQMGAGLFGRPGWSSGSAGGLVIRAQVNLGLEEDFTCGGVMAAALRSWTKSFTRTWAWLRPIDIVGAGATSAP